MIQDEVLSTATIRQAIRTRWLARPVHFLRTVSSTNTVLAEMAGCGAAHGTLVITDFQSAGRGRLGRTWEVPEGTSLLLSLLFYPQWPVSRAPWLTMLGGLAAATAVEAETNLRAGLKWPNDVMLKASGRWHKAGGLLLETELENNQVQRAILGIGLNVNVDLRALPNSAIPATSIQVALGKPLSRLKLLATLLEHLETLYDAAERGESPQQAWNSRLITRYQRVHVHDGRVTISGIAEGTNEWGQLLVRDAQGVLHAVPVGDVTLRDEADDE